MADVGENGPGQQVRAVILAAGQGSRLGHLTADRPKVLLDIAGRAILDHQIESLRGAGVSSIHIVAGHAAVRLARAATRRGVGVFVNPDFATTNMVSTLMCARPLLDGTGDLIVSYGDIVYQQEVVEALALVDADMTVVVDHDWLRYWSARMTNPLSDAETLRLAADGHILAIGSKACTTDEIDGQYIGLIRIRAAAQRRLVMEWDRLDAISRVGRSDRAPSQSFMTDLIQHLIDRGWDIRQAPIHGGWLEFDHPDDLSLIDAGFWAPMKRGR